MKAPSATVLLLIVGMMPLAGCLQPEDPAHAPADPLARLSQPRYEGVLDEHLSVPSFDGTTLDAWVFRPDTAKTGEKVPVVINFSPYWSNLAPAASTGGDAFSQYLIDYFVPRGYAAALVSARGTGHSEGCFTIGGPTELADEDAAATFLATQPWANGNVTASGKSYDGTMAQGLITTGNPHVKTIVPVAPISELYKYNYFYGVPYFVTGHAFNTYYVAETSLVQQSDPSTLEQTPTRFCDEAPGVQANQFHSFALGDYTPYWQARNYSAMLPDDDLPSVFYIHGLQDWNVKPDHMVPWIQDLRDRGATVKMWLGDWAHDYPHREDWNQTMLRWFDHYLKGIDTGILDEPLVQVQDDEEVWRHEDVWPPERARRVALHPTAQGGLEPGPGTGSSMYHDAPTSLLEAIRFDAAPIKEDVRLVGEPLFHAQVSTSGADGTLAVALLRDGEVIDQGFLDLAHRDGMESSDPMVPGTVYDVTVRFYPQDLVLPKGSRLSLVVGHTSPSGSLVSAAPVPTGNLVTVHHGESTFLSLPVIAAANASPEVPQPEDVGCWAC